MKTIDDVEQIPRTDASETWEDRRWKPAPRVTSASLLLLPEAILVFLLYSLMTVVLTYPIVFHMTDSVPGAYRGDNFHFLWQMWYPAHAVIDLHKSPLFDPDIYVPFGFDLIRNQDLSPANVLLMIPVTWLLGEVFTYNLVILATYPLTGLGTYLLARQLWGSRAGAVLAGAIVAFCEYRYVRTTGHLTMLSTQWIPLFFLALERTLIRPSISRGMLTGLMYALCALVTWTYAWLVAIAAVFYLVVRLRWWRDWRVLMSLIPAGLAAGVVVAVLVGPIAVPYARGTTSGQMSARPLLEAQAFSASVADFLIPGVEHPLWGDLMRRTLRLPPNNQWLSEWEVYLGIAAVLFAAVGVASLRDRRVTALLAMAAGAFVFSLGPTLYWTHPPAAELANLAPLSPIPLPVSVLSSIPPFSFMRGWARMGFFVQVAVGLLAALGLKALLGALRVRLGWRSPVAVWAVTAAAVALVVFDSLSTPIGLASVAPRPVEQWLAQQPGDVIFMEYPAPNHGYSGPAMYSTRLTGKRIIMGYASYPPNLPYWGTLARFPSTETLDLLAQWGTKYVLVDETLYRAGDDFFGVHHTWATLQPAIAASGRLGEVTVQGGVHVYELGAGAPRVVSSNLLQDPDFEDAVTTGPVGWEPVGKPVYSRSAEAAHGGSGAIAVTASDLYVSSPTVVTPGECYELTLAARSDELGSMIRLQVNWLDAAGVHLDSRTAGIRVVPTSPVWQVEHAQFRAPAEATGARVYAVAHQGRVWLDDYALQVAHDGCAPTLGATPNPVPDGPDAGPTAVNWDTASGEGQVWVAREGEPERLFADGPYGMAQLQLESGSTYELRLYADRDRKQLLKTLVVRRGS